ncbi:hypothetical protein M569_16497, partial [Genlisea aurea]
MEVGSRLSSRPNSMASHPDGAGDAEISDIENLELETLRSSSPHPMNALEILRETIRILRQSSAALLSVTAVLICPVSAVFLSSVLVDESVVKWLTLHLMIVAKSGGLPLDPVVKRSCQRFSEMAVSAAVCFPLFTSALLLSKAAVVFSIGCTYSGKQFDPTIFKLIVSKIWKRILSTYLLVCTVLCCCYVAMIILLNAFVALLFAVGFSSDSMLYAAFVVGPAFAVVLANATVASNVAVVASILEEVSGPRALLRSLSLVRGRRHVGMVMFLGSTVGTVFVEGLFEHRVRVISYGDGSSRLWEGPLLVFMHSFLLLIDTMMNAIFYFDCKSCRAASTED